MSRPYLLSLLLLFSCATDVPTTTLARKNPPFLKRYKKGMKELLYVVVDNSRSMNQETRDLIASNIKRFDPEIAITMIPPEEPEKFTKDLNACEVNESDCTPEAWTYQSAKPRGIPCVTGLPYQSEILRETVKRGPALDEVLFFYVYLSLQAEHKQNKKPLEKLAFFIELNKKLLNAVSPMNEERFFYHYRDFMKSKTISFSSDNLTPKSEGHYLQQLSKSVMESKDWLILKRIKTEQLAHERVVVVFTLDQFKRHHPPLEKFFSTELP